MTLMQPVVAAYSNVSYDSLETAIFPSYFHGKCQRFSKDGQDPPGCPDPDCPVVCGTPGSLVHFYPTLRYIAFNSTRETLTDIMKTGSPAYVQVEERIKNAQLQARGGTAQAKDAGMDRAGSPLDVGDHSHAYSFGKHAHAHGRHFGTLLGRRGAFNKRPRETPSDMTLAQIVEETGSLLEKACGGNANDDTSGLPDCSWETNMKKYILSFN
ncbi:hypothetical protein EW145_g360 [Phellinidium pouzarii]|uniref:Uncharacterized protein n=1 Tax=Phellinidium pouzarii TaxID=167371 RepID=A0A4S4LP93_9AGAM|nr:hypothetical protein EW145_g360 [Phellinidium pouzarii]